MTTNLAVLCVWPGLSCQQDIHLSISQWPCRQMCTLQSASNSFIGCNFYILHCQTKCKIFGKLNGSTRIWHFDLLEMAWHQLQTSIVTLIKLLRTKCVISNVQYFKIRNRIYRIVSILILLLKFSNISRVFITALWICGNFVCVQWFVTGVTHNLWPVAG